MPTRVGKELSNRRCLQIACRSSHTLFLTDTVSVQLISDVLEHDVLRTWVCTGHGLQCKTVTFYKA